MLRPVELARQSTGQRVDRRGEKKHERALGCAILNAMPEYVGTCACGRVEVRLRSELAPGEFQPRSDAATCAFCREYDGVWISDPRGTLMVPATDETIARTFASAK